VIRARVEAARKLVAAGATWLHASACLEISDRTLRHWRQQEASGGPLKLRGRPLLETTVAERNQVFRFLEDTTGPMIGVPTLRSLFTKMPRVVLGNMLVRYRRWWRNKHAVHGHRLTWHVAGAVWAMDYTKTKHPIDGSTQIIFTVRDLASHYHLCWVPVADEKAETVIPILHGLFELHAPPLVLKSDNGSAFIAEPSLELLDDWRVLPLFSPPRQPKYNGALERSNTTLKVYTHTSAVNDGHPFRWTSDDLAQAVFVANEFSRPWGAKGETPTERWHARAPLSEPDRLALLDMVEAERKTARKDLGFDVKFSEGELSVSDHRAIDRMAIARSLQELGHLTAKPIRRRAPNPKRPDSERRELWVEKRACDSKAAQAATCAQPTACAPQTNRATQETRAAPKPKQKRAASKNSLAQKSASVTMQACPEVSASRAATPHDSPPKQRMRAIFTLSRMPITLLKSLAKAARIM